MSLNVNDSVLSQCMTDYVKNGLIHTNGKSGRVVDSIENVQYVFENDVYFKDAFFFNRYNGKREIVKRMEWMDEDRKTFTKSDFSHIIKYLQTNYSLGKKDNIADALDIVFEKNRYNPLQDYFASLKWDGVCRAEELFIDFLGCDDSLYTRLTTRKFLLAIVTKTFYNVHYDRLLVLEGKENIGKDFLLEKLMPEKEMFSNSFVLSKEVKENIEQTQGKSLVVWQEMNVMKGSLFERFKAFMTSSYNTVRMAYNADAQDYQMRCVFASTSNEENCVPDEEGNRRILVLHCDKSKRKKVVGRDFTKEYRNQIWAEMYYYYMQDEDLFYGEDFERAARQRRSEHLEENPVKTAVWEFLETASFSKGARITTNYIYESAVSKRKGVEKMSPADARTISKVLNDSGMFRRTLTKGKIVFEVV